MQPLKESSHAGFLSLPSSSNRHHPRIHPQSPPHLRRGQPTDPPPKSPPNPRRTFDEAKLYELAESIKHNGLIQPITVRPNNQGFEIVTGARRYLASLLAEKFTIPVAL